MCKCFGKKTDGDSAVYAAKGSSFHHLGARTETSLDKCPPDSELCLWLLSSLKGNCVQLSTQQLDTPQS